MLDIAIINLRYKKLRTGLTILGVAICANLFIIVTSIANFISGDLNRQVEAFRGQVIVMASSEQGQRGLEWPPVSSSIDEATAATVLALPRIEEQRSSGLLFVALAPPPYPGGPPEALAVGVTPGREASLMGTIKMAQGRASFPPGAEHEVILGVVAGRLLAGAASTTAQVPTVAGPLTVPAVGSTLLLRGQELTVVGVMEPGNNQLFRGMVIMPLSTAQAVFNRPGSVSAVLLTPQGATDADLLAARIEQEQPLLRAVTNAELASNASQMLSQQQRFMDIMRGTAVVAAAVIVMIVMFVAVLERTRELGTLRAIGAPSVQILLMIILESLVIVVVGVAIGVPVSMFVLNNAFADGKALNDQTVWAWSAALLTGVGLFASLLPAWRATRVDPIVAMHYE